jgi:hypothetical protein
MVAIDGVRRSGLDMRVGQLMTSPTGVPPGERKSSSVRTCSYVVGSSARLTIGGIAATPPLRGVCSARET